jgi:hypothetical protein
MDGIRIMKLVWMMMMALNIVVVLQAHNPSLSSLPQYVDFRTPKISLLPSKIPKIPSKIPHIPIPPKLLIALICASECQNMCRVAHPSHFEHSQQLLGHVPYVKGSKPLFASLYQFALHRLP